MSPIIEENKYWILLTLICSLIERWLGRTDKTKANSILDLLEMFVVWGFKKIWSCFKQKGKLMDTDIVSGPVGKVHVQISKGVVSLTAEGDLIGGGVAATAGIKVDGALLIDALAAEIAKKLPPGGAVIEAAVVDILKAAIKAIE